MTLNLLPYAYPVNLFYYVRDMLTHLSENKVSYDVCDPSPLMRHMYFPSFSFAFNFLQLVSH